MQHNNRFLRNIVLPTTVDKKGKSEKIKVLSGPHVGKIFEAKRVDETINGKLTTFYYVTDAKIKTYFLTKDISVIK